jgi:oligopeptide transport system substrate-binding protein
MAHDVFVSYSSKDKVIADSIVASLEKNNIRCWYAPRDIKPSDDWGEAISQAIESSKVFLIIFSGHANHSQHVLDELLYAITEERAILPYRIENLEPKGAMRLHLSSRHWLDAYDPSWEPYLKKLILNVSNILDSDISESDIELDEAIGKQIQKGKKKELSIAVSIIVIIAVIIAGWFAFPFLFPSEDIAEVTGTTTNLTTSTQTQTVKSTETTPTTEPIARDGQLNLALTENFNNLDPGILTNKSHAIVVNNLFMTLVKYDPVSSQLLPAAAESWSISLDGRFYTFKIREDIPWVHHSLGGKTEQVLDENGEPRYVTAQDFVHTIRYLCNPNSESYVPEKISGCLDVISYEDPQNIPEDLFIGIGAKAISDHELLIELKEPSSAFLTTISFSELAPRPSWAIEKYGNAWTNPGNIHTNGYYVIDQVQLGESLTLIRNELLPEDLAGSGNIGTIHVRLDIPIEEQYELWKNGELDISPIPEDFIKEHKKTYPDNILSGEIESWTYFDLNTNKEPFNNIHVRHAFAAALDKQALIDNYLAETAIVLNNMSISSRDIASPDVELKSVTYDPQNAQKELAEAGYPNCQGFPTIKFFNITQLIQFPEQALRDWEIALGCPENTILYNHETWNTEETDLVLWGWGDISLVDHNNRYDFHIWCQNTGTNSFYRECNEIDDLIVEARQIINLDDRTNMNAQIEEALFGSDGLFPIIPLFSKRTYYAINESVEINTFSNNFYDWHIEMESQP